jgi:aspartyl-tRNA(Asn)/glutamyl-tRNA(Gln) amidotransferase subunit C
MKWVEWLVCGLSDAGRKRIGTFLLVFSRLFTAASLSQFTKHIQYTFQKKLEFPPALCYPIILGGHDRKEWKGVFLMANIISDETIEYVGILAKLELSDEEKEQAKKDMGSMLDYIDKLNELDTSGVEPMSHVFPVNNVFREDVVVNGDGSADLMENAPESRDSSLIVPMTTNM